MKKAKGSMAQSNFKDCTKQHMKKTGNFSTKKSGQFKNHTYSGKSKQSK